ncbi:MAG: OsmC family protein [Cellvibrionaceae bacterium]|nr:OsmC family protein [Cellvibrionaceae bacterium]
MKALPHQYRSTASAGNEGLVDVAVSGLENILIAPPADFGGPGDTWSPEDLMTSAISSCLVLSFRAIARAAKLEWTNLEVAVEGELAKDGKAVRFTKVTIKAKLTIAAGMDAAKAEDLLAKAKATCFITNSMNSEVDFSAEVLSA